MINIYHTDRAVVPRISSRSDGLIRSKVFISYSVSDKHQMNPIKL